MIHLTMTPFISHIRAYLEPDGYARKRPYVAITTVAHLGDEVAYLCAAVGDVNRETWQETLKLLKEAGFTTVMLLRHRTMKTIAL